MKDTVFMRRTFALILIMLMLIPAPSVWATPTQFGDSGMISQPTADTHQSGSIAVGLWSNYSTFKQGSTEESSFLLPVSITLGLGSFVEAYGSYPNLTFNGDEGNNITSYPVTGYSDRGYTNLGLKMRLLGSRSGPYRFAVDGQARRNVRCFLCCLCAVFVDTACLACGSIVNLGLPSTTCAAASRPLI